MSKTKGFLVICMAIVMSLCSCIGNKDVDGGVTEPTTKHVTIPESFIAFCNYDGAEDLVESYQSYGVKAEKVGNDVQIIATTQQIDELIEMNNNYIAEMEADFKTVSEDYRVESDLKNGTITFYCDEDIDVILLGRVIYGIVACSEHNHFLETLNTDWSATIVIKNCTTGEIVTRGTLPGDEILLSTIEWN